MRGWTKNADALSKKLKLEIIEKIDKIDKNAEIMGMFAHDFCEQKDLRA